MCFARFHQDATQRQHLAAHFPRCDGQAGHGHVAEFEHANGMLPTQSLREGLSS